MRLGVAGQESTSGGIIVLPIAHIDQPGAKIHHAAQVTKCKVTRAMHLENIPPRCISTR
jgi:hypothetical protein